MPKTPQVDLTNINCNVAFQDDRSYGQNYAVQDLMGHDGHEAIYLVLRLDSGEGSDPEFAKDCRQAARAFVQAQLRHGADEHGQLESLTKLIDRCADAARQESDKVGV